MGLQIWFENEIWNDKQIFYVLYLNVKLYVINDYNHSYMCGILTYLWLQACDSATTDMPNERLHGWLVDMSYPFMLHKEN